MASASSPLWVMIPARGGSRGVPRKNVRLLAGVPMIVRIVRIALEACPADRIVVITDDDEIDALATAEGVRVVREPTTTGRATLDEVALKVVAEIDALGAKDSDVFLTLEPTCPFLRAERIREAVAAFDAGAGSVLTVADDRHLAWTTDEAGAPRPVYTARVNRQLLPPYLRETGAVIGCRLGELRARRTRIVEPIRLIEVTQEESLDIDDFADWAVAEYVVSRRSIALRADASETMGMGHAYRALAVAQELARHRIVLATDAAKPLGAELFSRYPFELAQVAGDEGFLELVRARAPELVILDQLDTSREYVRALKAVAGKVVTFEDLGSGALEADLLVSDLYENVDVPSERQLTGVENAVLAPNFETDRAPAPFHAEIARVLVVFGGSDPSHLTEKALAALAAAEFEGEVAVVAGPGVRRRLSLEEHGLRGALLSDVRHMPGVMRQADLALSSAGRTVTELISLGVPVLCLCQNEKELTHTHASARYGVINLGLGALVGLDTLAGHIRRLADAPDLRRLLRDRAMHETKARGNAAVIARMMERLGLA
jgi:spore coat polysaccharide biosynthesis predicted glycosyltransferase SpsG